MGVVVHTYDAANRLVSSVAPTGTTTYSYNGHNLVVQETLTVAGVVTTTAFIWNERSGLPRLVGTARSDGQLEQYVYGPEGVHAQYTSNGQGSSTLLYTLLDRQGSVRGLENVSTQTSSAMIYDAWGNVRWQTGALSSRLGYTGELTNRVDGTVFLRARHYLPASGRFLQRDSFQGNLESPQTIHKYTYGNNNPLFYTDPTGHCPESDNFYVCVQTLGFSEEQKAEWMQFVAWRLQADPYIDTSDMPDFYTVYIEDAYTAAYIWDSYMGADLEPAERDLRQLRYYVDEKNGHGIYSWLKLYQTYLIGPVIRQVKGIVDLPGPSSDSEFYGYLEAYHICYNKDDQIVGMAAEEVVASAAEFGALTASTMREASRYRSGGSASRPHAGTSNLDTPRGVDDLPKLPGCSFTPDTLVVTAAGLTPIGDLAVGELVWAYNEATGTTDLYTITAVLAHADPVLVDLTIDGEPLTTTPEHPCFTRERSWVAAGDLRLGEHLRAADGSWGTVERLLLRRDTRVMYNLTVATAHTFFVGDGQWLVHNQ